MVQTHKNPVHGLRAFGVAQTHKNQGTPNALGPTPPRSFVVGQHRARRPPKNTAHLCGLRVVFGLRPLGSCGFKGTPKGKPPEKIGTLPDLHGLGAQTFVNSTFRIERMPRASLPLSEGKAFDQRPAPRIGMVPRIKKLRFVGANKQP